MLLGGPPFSLRRSPMSIGVPHGSGGVPIVRVGGGPIFLSGGGEGGGAFPLGSSLLEMGGGNP